MCRLTTRGSPEVLQSDVITAVHAHLQSPQPFVEDVVTIQSGCGMKLTCEFTAFAMS